VSELGGPAPHYVSVGFVAKRCGVSNTTVLRWISSGELPAFRLPGGHYRIDGRDFAAFSSKYRIPFHEPRADDRPGDGTTGRGGTT
jgi:excisionase family DNA binding protein